MLIALYECDAEKLNDLNRLEAVLEEAVRVSSATTLKSSFHQFAPQGVGCVVIITESHFTIHTWPEYGYTVLDTFTCGKEINSQKTLDFIEKKLNIKTISVTEIRRGNIRFPIKINKKSSPKVGVY